MDNLKYKELLRVPSSMLLVTGTKAGTQDGSCCPRTVYQKLPYGKRNNGNFYYYFIMYLSYLRLLLVFVAPYLMKVVLIFMGIKC